MSIKKGDIVARISYGKDIIFVVDKIIKSKNENIAILNGLTIRITADAPISELEYVDKKKIETSVRSIDERIKKRAENSILYGSNRASVRKLEQDSKKIYTGKILHLDGDKRYSDKSVKYYKQLGLDAVVKNIPEYKQAYYVRNLLEQYKPDILIITGHDSMIKKGAEYNNIYNYRNSRHFANAVREARKWGETSDKLVIFAGACQSYFEELMIAGADFASSPGRILIDFVDPIIVAEKVAKTDINRYVTITQIVEDLKEGRDGIGGTGVKGKKYYL